MNATTPIVLAAALSLLASGGSAQPASLDTGGRDWVEPTTEIAVHLDLGALPAGDRLAIFLDQTDLTDLFRPAAGGLAYRADELPLPPGEHELALLRLRPDGTAEPVATFPLRVLRPGGFTRLEPIRHADVEALGALTESGSAAANPEDAWGDLRLGLGLRLERPSSTLEGSLEVLGSTLPERALQAGAVEDPDRADLASWQLRWSGPARQLEAGHTQLLHAPDLAEGHSGRGVRANWSLRPGLEVRGALLSGTHTVGWSRPFGVERASNRIGTVGLGLELAPGRPGSLRVDVSYLDGSVVADSGFGRGAVTDAEESDGWSLRLQGGLPSGRASFDASLTRSTFRNPGDPFLEQGADLVPVTAETRESRRLALSLDLLAGHRAAERGWTLAASADHRRTDPLFRSVGARTASDIEENGARVLAGFREVALEVDHRRSEDNLDRVPSILTTRTRQSGARLSLPLASLLAPGSEARAWMPQLELAVRDITQRGLGVPENGGFAPGHVPDQRTETFDAALAWAGATWQAGWRHGSSRQDNRQPGREDADFTADTDALFATFAPHHRVELGFELSRERLESRESGETNVTDRLGVDVTWRPTDRWTFAQRLSWTLAEERLFEVETDDLALDSHLAFRLLSWQRPGTSGSGQLYTRYRYQETESTDPRFALSERQRGSSLTAGLTLQFH